MNSQNLKVSQITRNWHLVDASTQTLGRVSTGIAKLLMGKSKAFTSPNLDSGDYVVVINAKDLKVTGNKLMDKLYQHHSMFPGGFKEYRLEEMMAKDPRKVIEHAVAGMLPKNKLRADRLKRLKIFTTSNHPYSDKFAAKV